MGFIKYGLYSEVASWPRWSLITTVPCIECLAIYQLFLVMLMLDLIVTLIHHDQLFYFSPISYKFCFWKWRLGWVEAGSPKWKTFCESPHWALNCRTQDLEWNTLPTSYSPNSCEVWTATCTCWLTCLLTNQLTEASLPLPVYSAATVLIGQQACQSTCACGCPHLTAVGGIARGQSVSLKILSSAVQSPVSANDIKILFIYHSQIRGMKSLGQPGDGGPGIEPGSLA